MNRFRIYLSQKRKNKDNKLPIYFKIFISGHVFQKSSSIYIEAKEFDRSTKRITGNSKIVHEQNAKLDKLDCLLTEAINDRILNQTLINSIFDTVLLNKETGTLMATIDNYILSLKQRINNNQANAILPITYKKNVYLRNALEKYLVMLKKTKIPVAQVDKVFIGNLINHYRNNMNYTCGHTNRVVKFIKSALRYSIDEGLSIPTTALSVRLQTPEKEIIYLNNDQLRSLTVLNLKNSSLEKIRDLFLVQCYSGLSYADLPNLNQDWLYEDSQGNVFLKYKRKKTGAMATVPIQRQLLVILEKYNFQLPVISNQKYNQYLKLVGLAANLPFPLTSHIGRKTCGSLLLNSGVNIYTVKTILGHSSVKTTESHYAQLNETGIIKDIAQARNITIANTVVAQQMQLFGS